MYGVRMVEKGTSERIASVALRILVEEGAQAVTMRRVATGAGITPMATYRHYPNREVLLRTVADAAFAELGEAWGRRGHENDCERRIYGLLEDFLDFALGKPNLYSFLITDRRPEARLFPQDYRAGGSPAFTPVVEAVDQGMKDGTFLEDEPMEVAVNITSCAMGLVQMYLNGRIGLTEAEFRELCRRATGRVIRGIRT